jgi:hypothetical protein
MVEENMCFLSARQNLYMTKSIKHAARLYLLNLYGEERIQAWLDSIQATNTVSQLLAQTET